MRKIMSIIGGGQIDTLQAQQAEALGRLAVEAGFRICCGGRGGVMTAACRGARQARGYRDGDTIGILPGVGREAANPYVDIIVPTGMGHGRNLLVVSTGDVVVAVAGGAGTLSEIALAWQLDRPIVLLETSGGWSARLVGEALDDRARAPIQRASSPEVAVRIAQTIVDLEERAPASVTNRRS